MEVQPRDVAGRGSLLLVCVYQSLQSNDYNTRSSTLSAHPTLVAAVPTKAVTMASFRAKAPLRVSFAGGGTDVPPFPEREGGLVLSATIDRHSYGTLRPRMDGQIAIHSVDFGIQMNWAIDEPIPFDGRLDLVKAAVRQFGKGSGGGFELFLHSSVPPGSGLGSSSSTMVTLIGLLREYHALTLSDYEVARLAYVVEREDLGLKGGMQDQYAATFGGFNFIEFWSDGVVVNPLRISTSTLNELEMNLLLAYTGHARLSDNIIQDQTERFEHRDENALAGLRSQKELAVEMKNALLQRKLSTFGDLLGRAWEYKKMMSPRVTTPYIDEAYELAITYGALGGKVTGAGGGGHMLFYCPFEKKHKVAEELTKLGVTTTQFSFDLRGLRSWRSSSE
jgi:D-glycero-alpha-D-manno-heptose-7-phosphate kinase